MDLIIRPERKEDYSEISEVISLAFGQDNESILVEKLRETSEFINQLSIVAENNKKIIGHILFYPVIIVAESKHYTTLSLAPMAVHPSFQNKGVGTRLVNEGIKAVKRAGYNSVIVVGHPAYYLRFGFRQASLWGIKAPFEVPDEAFLAIELEQDSLKNINGVVVFPAEYYDAL